jgi:hypothetical protein
LKFDQVIVLLALRDSALDFACNKKKSPSRCSLKLQDSNAKASSLGVHAREGKSFFSDNKTYFHNVKHFDPNKKISRITVEVMGPG